MLLDKYEKKYKRFLALLREDKSIGDAMRSLPWTEVKPYQDGWKIYIDFRDDIKNRVDYPSLRIALDLVSIQGSTKNAKTVKAVRNLRRLDSVYAYFRSGNGYVDHSSHSERDIFSNTRYGTYHYKYGREPILGRLLPCNYDKQPATVQHWFTKVKDDTKYWRPKEWYQLGLPYYWLIVKTKPAMVTHIKAVDNVLLQKEAEIDAALASMWRDFGEKYRTQGWANHMGNRALRSATRAQLQKVLKGETEDFELKKKIRNYD